MQTTQYHTIRFKRPERVGTSWHLRFACGCAGLQVPPTPTPIPSGPLLQPLLLLLLLRLLDNPKYVFVVLFWFCLYTRLFSGSTVSLCLVVHYFIYSLSRRLRLHSHSLTRIALFNRHSLLLNTYTILSPPPTSRNYFYFPFWATSC